MSGNDCIDSYQGIFFFSDGVGGKFCGDSGCPVPGGFVSLNNFAGNIEYGIFVDPDAGGGPLSAECNWWGDSNGPSGEGPGSGDFVSENVVFSPWSPVEFRDAHGQRNAGGYAVPAPSQLFPNGDSLLWPEYWELLGLWLCAERKQLFKYKIQAIC